MGLKEDMDAAWLEGKENRSVQAFRAASRKINGHTSRGKTAIDKIIAEGTFNTVADSIKTEGAAIRQLINQFATAMEQHSEFLNWRPPVE